MDLDINSYYKCDNLYIRINNLCNLLDQIEDCYEYLKDIEIEGFSYAGRRLLLKRLLIAFVSAFAMFANILLGVLSYFTLSTIANNYYASEIGDITLNVEKYHKYDLKEISKVLRNCAGLLKRKMDKYYKEDEQNKISEDVIIVNNYLSSFLEGESNIEQLLSLNDKEKLLMLKMLQKDLISDSNDLNELLNTLKTKNDNEIKLIKEIN